MSNIVLVEERDSVAVITLNRPGKLNALDYVLTRALSG
jgi:enoyl-CoA hydratase/carnithine racemase